MTDAHRRPRDDMLETAMGLISAADNWNSAGLRWKGDVPVALPPSDSPDSVEWRAAARIWLDAYGEQLHRDLTE